MKHFGQFGQNLGVGKTLKIKKEKCIELIFICEIMLLLFLIN